MSLFEKGEYEKSIMFLEEAVHLNKKEPIYHLHLAFVNEKLMDVKTQNQNDKMIAGEDVRVNRVRNPEIKAIKDKIKDEYESTIDLDKNCYLALLNYGVFQAKEGYFEEDIDRVSEYSKNNINYWNAERSRIFGYEEIESLSLEIKDFDNPTEEELNTWYKFTPAQKVMWLIMNIDTSKSIFKYLEVNLNNQRELNDKGYSAQTIRFNESTELMEEIYSAFNDSAFNKNILIRSAVYDLVKYAFIVEGFKFKRGGLSKVITNKFL
jgi:tetratricopeptide (TPR) repeat protein